MDNLKNDQYFVRKIQEDLAFIIKHMKNVDGEELAHNEPMNSGCQSIRAYLGLQCLGSGTALFMIMEV